MKILDKTSRPSIFDKSPAEEMFSPTPDRIVRQLSLGSNSSACDEWNTITKKNISFSINLSESKSSPKHMSSRKYIEIRRVSSIEPVFKEILKWNSLFQLLHLSTTLIK